MSHAVELCVSAIVVDSDERLLLVERGHEPDRGRWALPGGRVDAGETLREAVVRETLEETGIPVVTESLVGLAERIGSDHHYVIASFGAVAVDDVGPTAGGDASLAKWVPLWEVADVDLVDGLLDFLSEHGYLRVIT